VPPIATIALLAAALQFSLYLVLRRRERPPGDQPTLLLTTDHPPDLARLDVLRGIWCRTLVTDALLIGRQASAWVTAGVDRPGALGAALDGGLPGGRSTDADPAHDVQGVLHATHGGHALTFAVVGGPGAEYAGSGPARPRPLVLDLDRVAPTEPPTWIVEVLVGIPRSAAAALTAGRHPLGVLAGAAAAAGFNVVHAQHPTAPPWHGPADREWMRARIGVPFVPGEDLSGLRSLLLAVDHLRGVDPGWGSPRVHVHVVPELATYEAVQTAPDDPARRGPANGERSRAATEVDISGSVPPDGLDVDPRVQPLALFATARPGLLAGVLASLVEVAPQARVAGVTVGALHGLTGVFLFLRDAGPRPGEAVRARIAPAHEVQVAVDGHQPPPADTAIGTAPAVRGNELLRLQIRTPDRPAALRSTLASFEALIRRRAEDAGRTSDPLDVWFAMFRVAEGRTVQGRLVARLPAGVDWTTTGWDGLAQAATDHSDADRVEDDAFVTADLLRTVDDPAPTVVDARPAVGE
jgi:hypothetical protein